MTPGAGRLLVLACGGTISSLPPDGAGTPVTPALGAAQLLAAVPQLGAALGAVHIEARTFSTVPSADMTLDDVVRLRATIDAWITAGPPGPVGVVVTHGTDTLEETAYALELLAPDDTADVPVVVTGAMRNPSLPSPDGPANLLAAAGTAVHPDAVGLGVLVAFHDELHLAALVRKGHTSSPATFTSAPFGPIGYLAEGDVRVVLRPARRSRIGPPADAPGRWPVALLATGMSDDGRLLDAAADAGFAGAVLVGVGGGHVPAALAGSTSLARLVERMPVVLSSRVGAGELLRRTYGFAGSETDLAARGLVGAGRLDGPKARVALTLALAAGQDRERIADTFRRLGGGRTD